MERLPRRRRLACLLLLLLLPQAARAFEIHPGSTGNRLYVVLWNRDLAFSMSGISVSVTPTALVPSITPVHVPTSLAANGARIAAFAFSVPPGAAAGTTGTLDIHVSGVVDGVLRQVSQSIALRVVSGPGATQGLIGDIAGVPGLTALDSDGDGQSDQAEILLGTDPFHSGSEIPALPAPLAIALAGVLALAGFVHTARRRRV
jgi:hypothetical protein